MADPEFIIRKEDRTPGGAISTANLKRIRNLLLGDSRKQGVMMVPSDTGYSIAARPMIEFTSELIPQVLKREKDPISLAFSNIHDISKFIIVKPIIGALLNEFTPGPITIVCAANKEQIPHEFLRENIFVNDSTVGIRIPDSREEREIAGCIGFPVTTTAVRDSNGIIVQEFTAALDIVAQGMDKIGFSEWGAVEGGSFFPYHSTVVRVKDDSSCEIIREGAIPSEKIFEVVKRVNVW
jgi:L-threonylcarbamoyladenylate synthase